MPVTIDFHGLTAAYELPNVSSATARLKRFFPGAIRIKDI